jgi:hypothetical protein
MIVHKEANHSAKPQQKGFIRVDTLLSMMSVRTVEGNRTGNFHQNFPEISRIFAVVFR